MSGHRTHLCLVCCMLLLTLPSISSAQTDDAAFKSHLDLAEQALKARKYGDAIGEYKKAIKIRASCSECYLSLAIAYVRAGQYEDGLKTCDRALSGATDDGSRAAAHNMKGNLLLSRAEDDKKKLLSAEAEYRAAIQLDAKPAVYHLNLARALFKQVKDDDGKKSLEDCLASNPDTTTATQARQIMADPRRAREEFAPNFQFQSLQGDQFTLQQLKGRVLVMDFWATWCPPCRASVPELKDLTRKYSTNKLVLISVSADDDEVAWKDFIAKKAMEWPQYRDANHAVLDAFNVHSYPTYLVIDGDGIIKKRIVGLDPQQSVVFRLKQTLEGMPQLEGESRK
jgi:thiol-disulfide isomerase/thioredoxin/Tfp pilus assembly protein PilF